MDEGKQEQAATSPSIYEIAQLVGDTSVGSSRVERIHSPELKETMLRLTPQTTLLGKRTVPLPCVGDEMWRLRPVDCPSNDTERLRNEVIALCGAVLIEVLGLNNDSLNEMIKHWNHSPQGQVILAHPDLTKILIDSFFKVAHTMVMDNVDCDLIFLCLLRTNAYFLMQCLNERTPLHVITDEFIDADSDEEFFAWMPLIRKGYEMAYMAKNNKMLMIGCKGVVINISQIELDWLEHMEEPVFDIFLVTSQCPGEVTRYAIDESILVKWIFRAYSKKKGVPMKFLRFSFEGKLLFLSSVGKKTAEEIGLKQGSTITVSSASQSTTEEQTLNQMSVSNKPQRNSAHKKTKAKSKTKASDHAYSVTSEEEKLKQEHSKAISLVFGECAAMFKSIRERLAAMNLERVQPKSRRGHTTLVSATRPIDNPPMSGASGKAGKSHVLVRVGAVSNLYNTSKTLTNCKKRSSSHPACKFISIDLHGLTKSDALDKLDESLPKWVDVAMKGEYPFVVTVKIICGGGNQILSEAVTDWVQRNRHVANSPKSGFA